MSLSTQLQKEFSRWILYVRYPRYLRKGSYPLPFPKVEWPYGVPPLNFSDGNTSTLLVEIVDLNAAIPLSLSDRY